MANHGDLVFPGESAGSAREHEREQILGVGAKMFESREKITDEVTVVFVVGEGEGLADSAEGCGKLVSASTERGRPRVASGLMQSTDPGFDRRFVPATYGLSHAPDLALFV